MKMGLIDKKTDCCCEIFLWFCRIFGILAALVLWGAGVEATYYHHVLGIYMLVVAVLVSFLELVFVVNYFLDICNSSSSSKCLKVVDCLLWVDDWKKGLFYIALAVPCFIQPHDVLLGVVAGVIMFLSAMMYMLKTFKTRREQQVESLAQKPSYDRFDEIQEDLEDSIVNPNSMFDPAPSVAEQSEILEM